MVTDVLDKTTARLNNSGYLCLKPISDGATMTTRNQISRRYCSCPGFFDFIFQQGHNISMCRPVLRCIMSRVQTFWHRVGLWCPIVPHTWMPIGTVCLVLSSLVFPRCHLTHLFTSSFQLSRFVWLSLARSSVFLCVSTSHSSWLATPTLQWRALKYGPRPTVGDILVLKWRRSCWSGVHAAQVFCVRPRSAVYSTDNEHYAHSALCTYGVAPTQQWMQKNKR